MEDDHKKNIINVAIRKCGKIKNTKNVVKLYLNEDEANYYGKLYNATVYPIKSTTILEDITHNDEVFTEHMFDSSFAAELAPKRVYLVAVEKEHSIDENMLPIKHFICVNERLKNLQLYRQLLSNGMEFKHLE